ncbi:transcriptional regulator, LysR family [Pseudonocardia thermophila]|uniref:Transcriptional regulator, LysR family n=1 Tax=Pseudonocardia thermophila TaxID=1848 RepID=A0A1M6Q998_PSETH|nr:LysR substrate-binding domain-containing protein [Pseudonocardia thermophila]SHK16657.1 transcriptional regulator, LysR family [Pseudonocardia thermophila]
MRYRRLQYFVAVAEELSFTRAAERLHMAQPPLSQQIVLLEKELGVALFDRSRRNIRLTPAGAAFLPEARRLLADLDDTVRMIRRVAEGSVGRLSVGLVPSAADWHLPDVLRAFRADHPDVELVLRELPPDPLLEAVTAGRFDLGIMYRPVSSDGLVELLLASDELVLALPTDHPAAENHGPVSLAAVAGEPFVMPEQHDVPGLHSAISGAFADAGIVPRIAQRGVWLIQTVLALVAAGIGLALVPAPVALHGRPGVAFRPLRGVQRRAELVAVWRPEPVVATRDALVGLLRRFGSDS